MQVLDEPRAVWVQQNLPQPPKTYPLDLHFPKPLVRICEKTISINKYCSPHPSIAPITIRADYKSISHKEKADPFSLRFPLSVPGTLNKYYRIVLPYYLFIRDTFYYYYLLYHCLKPLFLLPHTPFYFSSQTSL